MKTSSSFQKEDSIVVDNFMSDEYDKTFVSSVEKQVIERLDLFDQLALVKVVVQERSCARLLTFFLEKVTFSGALFA